MNTTLETVFHTHKMVFSEKREQIAREALAMDIAYLCSNTSVIPPLAAQATQANVCATVRMPEFTDTIRISLDHCNL